MKWKKGCTPWNKGKITPQKVKDKISVSVSKVMMGHITSQTTKDKIGAANKGTFHSKGKLCPKWKGGRKATINKYNNSDKGKQSSKKHKEAKFDYIYNNWFEGSVLHHMRYTFPIMGIYIPDKIHRPYTHNLRMTNIKAFEWFLGGGLL